MVSAYGHGAPAPLHSDSKSSTTRVGLVGMRQNDNEERTPKAVAGLAHSLATAKLASFGCVHVGGIPGTQDGMC